MRLIRAWTGATARAGSPALPEARRGLGAVLRLGALSFAAAGALAGMPSAAGAGPSAYLSVLHIYERDGTVPACQFSSVQLEHALQGVDTYGAQYFADFTQAIQTALNTRASGACVKASGAAGVSATSGAGGSSRTGGSSAILGPPAHFGPLTAATSAGVPAPLAAMGAAAVAVGLLVALWLPLSRRHR